MEKHDCDRNTKMSAGLMSCVRENSPTLDENGDVATSSAASDGPTEPQKRRKFQPFRNLRRIFRRRTVSNADTNPSSTTPQPATATPTQSTENFGTLDSSTTDTTLSSTKSGTAGAAPSAVGVPTSVLQNNLRNEIKMRLRADHLMDSDRELNDYPRSLSEGRLMDSDISRDGLSQSHDSVFSESATASSLSIVLKNELADVLRKRRNHRPETSDEDLGLPQSPITPQRNKNRSMHHSEGSLSLLSGTSSDMDDEHSSGGGSANGVLDISTTSSYFNKSDMSRNSDEVDLDMSTTSTQLNHSAAKHKLAVRPKKKGPTRNRRSRESALLPSTPEVNEESLKLSMTDVTDTSQMKMKSKSLPHGVNPSAMEIHSYNATEPKPAAKPIPVAKTKPTTPAATATPTIITTTTTTSTSSTSIYVNKSISKSYDFSKTDKKDEKPATLPPKPQIVSPAPLVVAPPADHKEKEKSDGLLKRFLNRSMKKKKAATDSQQANAEDDDEGGFLDRNKTKIEQVTIDNHFENKPTFKTNPLFVSSSSDSLGTDTSNRDSDGSVGKKLKSGPASRQRVTPQEIPQVQQPLKQDRGEHSGGTTTIMIKPSEFVKEEQLQKSAVTVTATASPAKELLTQRSKEPRVTVSHQAKSDEHLSPARSMSHDESIAYTTPTKTQFRTPKIYNISPYQQKISKTEITLGGRSSAAPKRVEKSKSFRIYPDNQQDPIANNLTTSTNLPSLPNLVSKDDDYINDEFAMASKFKREFVRVEHLIKPPPSQSTQQKFEINDNNLLRPKDVMTEPSSHSHNVKNVLVTSNQCVAGERSPCASTQNISQIEENIDKLFKSSSFVTVLKTNEEPVVEVVEVQKVAEKPTTAKVPEFMKVQLNRVDSNRTKSHVVLSTKVDGLKDTKPIAAKRMSCEILEVPAVEAAKPPLPPTVGNRQSLHKPAEEVVPTSPIRKIGTPVAMERKLSSHSITSDASSKRSSYSSQENLDDSKILLRRTSVSEERLKFERKSVATDSTIERKKSLSDELLDDSVVVMRKKSISDLDGTTLRSKDETPELMKVFARRSLKVRGEDEHKLHEELDKMHIKQQSNIDSDKENQSSEEKLDKLPKVEIKIVNNNNNNSVDKPRDTTKNNNCVMPTIKPFGTPNKFGNTAYRNSASFIENLRNQSNNKLTNETNSNTNIQAIANNNNTNSISSNLIKTLSNNSININSSHNQNVANNNVNINVVSQSNNRHTISSMAPSIKEKPIIGEDTASIEFKGILQRRAEWEKRAKEAFK